MKTVRGVDQVYCSKCSTWKVASAFYERANGRPRTPCKICINLRSRTWEKVNRERSNKSANARAKAYHVRHRDKRNEIERNRYAKQSRRIRERVRAYAINNPDRIRDQNLRRKGWSLELFNRAWDEQAGKCEICERQLILGGRASESVAADHNHANGKPRGLLCMRCNSLLGHSERFGDKISAYLKKYAI